MRGKSMRRPWASVAALCLAVGAAAGSAELGPETAGPPRALRIAGSVFDAAGAPVVGARVCVEAGGWERFPPPRLYPRVGTALGETTTGADGAFESL